MMIQNILDRDLWELRIVPLIAYLTVGFFVMEVLGYTDSKGFTFWSIIAALLLMLRDLVHNRIVSFFLVCYFAIAFTGLIWKDAKVWCAPAAMLGGAIVGLSLLRRLKKYVFSYLFLGYAAMIALIFLTLQNYLLSRQLVSFVIFLFLYAISQTITLWERENLSASFCILYLIVSGIVFFAPVSQEPYQWEFVQHIADAVKSLTKDISLELNYHWTISQHAGVYHVNFSGYAQGETLWNFGLKKNEIEQIVLEGKRTRRNLYLKGNVSDRFLGNTWNDHTEQTTLDTAVDTLMTLYAIFYPSAEDSSDDIENDEKETLKRIVEYHRLRVELKNIKTTSLFYPIKTISISSEENITVGDSMRTKTQKGRGYSYEVTFLDMDDASLEMIRRMQQASVVVYEEENYNLLFDKAKQYFGIYMEQIPFETFVRNVSEKEAAIHSAYTTVDTCVSENVRSLAKNIVQNCDTDYEKCRTIEKFLSQYTYSKQITADEDENLLDWFLFESQEGYCTYFATALVEMLRAVGIPARMAEGFLIDYAETERTDVYPITAESAHAWAEAYLDGFGWIRLDATPSAGNGVAWYPTDAADEEENTGSIQEETHWKDILQEEQVQREESMRKEEEEKEEQVFTLLLVGGMFCVAASGCLAFYLYQRIRIRKSSDPDVIFEDMMRALKREYRPKEEGETLKEYYEELLKQYGEDDFVLSRKELEQFTELLENYWYNEKIPAEDSITYIKYIREKVKSG